MIEGGAEWIGSIPEGWKLERLQWHIEEISVKNSPIKTTQILSLTNKKGVILYEDKGNQGNKSKDNLTEYKVAYPNTIIANSMNIIIGSVGLSKYEGCISPAYYVFRARKGTSIRFINYIFNTVGFQKELRKYANGILEIRLRVSSDNILKRTVAIPSIIVQEKIADFLDCEIEKINRLTADVQAQIEVLQQYRESVISEAVTGKHHNQGTMTQTGMKWVPYLPSEWSLIPAKHLFHNSDTRKKVDDEQLTASQKYGIVTQIEYMEKEQAQIVLATQGLDNWKHVEPNDFIISLRSFQGGLEMSEVTGCITWHYVVLKATKPICYRFYKWLFKSSLYINALQGTCNYIRDGQDLRFSNFSQVPLFMPPLDEQEEIADYLDHKCAEIDKMIEQKNAQLEVLDNYKKNLIYEYVTGKREVPVND